MEKSNIVDIVGVVIVALACPFAIPQYIKDVDAKSNENKSE